MTATVTFCCSNFSHSNDSQGQSPKFKHIGINHVLKLISYFYNWLRMDNPEQQRHNSPSNRHYRLGRHIGRYTWQIQHSSCLCIASSCHWSSSLGRFQPTDRADCNWIRDTGIHLKYFSLFDPTSYKILLEHFSMQGQLLRNSACFTSQSFKVIEWIFIQFT